MGKSAESPLSKGLLSSCTSGGCGAKIESDGLARLLAGLAPSGDKRLLVGYDTSDDAAVYMLDDERSLIFTADFSPPWSMTPVPLDVSPPRTP
jgi:selenide,water dikinase